MDFKINFIHHKFQGFLSFDSIPLAESYLFSVGTMPHGQEVKGVPPVLVHGGQGVHR